MTDPHHDGPSAFDELAADQEDRRRDADRSGRGRRRGERRRSNPLRTLLPALLVLAVVGALLAGGLYGYRWVTGNVQVAEQTPTDYPGPGTGEVVVTVEPGDTGADIASTLKENDVILSTGPFVTLFANTPEAGGISPGAYRLKKQMSSQDALDALMDPASVAGVRVAVPEGMRLTELLPFLAKETGIPVEDFETAVEDYRSLGIPENPANSAEGYLWPGRYDFPEDATAQDVLTTMAAQMQAQMENRGVTAEDQHRVLTIASIAEKEARTPEDYGRVARTIENRLEGVGEAGGHPMRLQLDSTVAYMTGKKEVSTTPADRARQSPYNTYQVDGLPIGPISNPGAATIDAVLDPPEGNWLYWVTVDTQTGETKFAATKSEHDKNVAEWRRRASERG
ncbi:endolytic transglycosylase MltG [Brachybacterium sp. EF45031]|uniref:endolytic transglycosylase MltG n=1 Tax=Brachybacterium sillae TaxID=2810536 RepID=UPI00217EEB62|nr:endolytic transglycosylase MltG [Brachybacterium sillae]MCS6710703.1 endolytic transglycosylase MltG [Brachybacterium sillae]